MTCRIESGDMLEVVPRLVAEGITVDAVVTDPPYHLTITGRFGKEAAAPAKSAAHRRLSKGFMGKSWDGGDVAFRPETWKLLLDVLRPGGFLLAFGGTRTFHRVACAIEDAGFTLQDTLCWLYGSGFPKRSDALKPAWEPIIVAYKPGGKRALGIKECRIPSGDAIPTFDRRDTGAKSMFNLKDGQKNGEHNDGRYPANVLHDGSDEVLDAFASFGSKGAFAPVKGTEPSQPGTHGVFASLDRRPGAFHADEGSAARFWYSAKADVGDRWDSRHPTVKPVDLMRWLVRLVCPRGGTVLDPFAGSGTTGAAALIEGRDAILIEREEEYIDDIRRRLEYRPPEDESPSIEVGLLGLPMRR